MKRIEWTFLRTESGFRLWKTEIEDSQNAEAMARSSLEAEMPRGDWFATIAPLVIAPDELAYAAAVAKQRGYLT